MNSLVVNQIVRNFRDLRSGKVWIVVFLSLVSGSITQTPARSADNPSLVEFIEKRLANQPADKVNVPKLQDICPTDTNPIAYRVFREYGAVFAVSENILIPTKCIFESESEVETFQDGLKSKSIDVRGIPIVLQAPAANALALAIKEANLAGKTINALDGRIAGKRNFGDTRRIWNSRYLPALRHWVNLRKITEAEADEAAAMPLHLQILKVMEWESKGWFFSTNFSISIFNSVAPPGTSQHLSLIGFDVVEASDPVVRAILNRNGWFQTIQQDEPHFTYLGVQEADLPSRGLKLLKRGGLKFWVPNMKS